jgi:gamma-glutamyltranspeptidase
MAAFITIDNPRTQSNNAMSLISIGRNLAIAVALTFSAAAQAVPAEGTQIMISAPSDYAVVAGKAAYANGGNLIDVAVAVGLTLAVTNPSNASLGGGGFALLSMGQGVEVLDFREQAPAATSPDFYVHRDKGASWNGGAAVGVPGVAAGLWAMHQKYGKLPWAGLFDTAMQLATDGIEFTGTESRKSESQKERLNPAGFRHFYKTPQQHYRPG